MAQSVGMNFDEFTQIDNTFLMIKRALNYPYSGTGASTIDWVDVVVGEGGLINWVILVMEWWV